MVSHDATLHGDPVVKTLSAKRPMREPDLRNVNTAITSDPLHPPSNRSGTDHSGSVKTRISALILALRDFDVSTIERRDDWKADAFASLFNATLADILGQNSQEYEKYSIQSFDTLPPSTGVDCPIAEVRQGYQRGINAAVRKLNLLLDTPDKKVGTTKDATLPARQPGPAAASSADGKISLVARRSELKSRQASSAMMGATAPGKGEAVKTARQVGLAADIVIDGQPEESRPKEGMAKARSQGSADILGKNGKEASQGGDLALNECLQAMQGARERDRLAGEKDTQDEPETVEITADEETHPLEPAGFVSAEFSYQEPCGGSLPDESPFDGKEALVPGGAAIVLGDDELPEPAIEDRRERAPWGPGAEPASEVSAGHVEPSAALASLDPLTSTEAAMTVVEENDSYLEPSSSYLDEKGIGNIENALPEMGEQAPYGKTAKTRVGWVGSLDDRLTTGAFRRSWSGIKTKISDLVSGLPARRLAAATVQPGMKTSLKPRPLEPAGFVSAEFSYQEPCAGSLPDESPFDGKEPLVPGGVAIFLGDDELPEPVIEDRRERALLSPGAEPALEVSAGRVESSAALVSLDPHTSTETAMTDMEENRLFLEPSSSCLDEKGIGDMESTLPEMGEQTASDLLPSGPVREVSSVFEHDPATEQVTEPARQEGLAGESPWVEGRAGEPERSDRGINFGAVEGELPATRLERANEPMSISSLDLSDVAALADRFAKEIAGPPEQKVPGAPEERLCGDTVWIPAGLDRSIEAASSGPAEGLVETVPEPVIMAQEVEQNPFAIKDFEKTQSRPEITGADDLRAHLRAITERIDDLKAFDVSTVTERFDPRAKALRDSVNNTIADVFGRNTPAYWHRCLPEFDTLPVVLGSPRPPSPEEVRGSYVRAIDKAVTKLTAIGESLKERLERIETGTKPTNELAVPSTPVHEKDTMVADRHKEGPPGVGPSVHAKEPMKSKGVERPVERVVIKAMEVDQNPFAMRDPEGKQSYPTRPVDLQTQVGAIVERINDLRSFDLTTITQRYDPRARELCDSVNNTIADVFGRNTPAYWRHSVPSFEAAYTIVGSPSRSPAELRRSYEEGINKAVTKLTAIAESLKSKLRQPESRSFT